MLLFLIAVGAVLIVYFLGWTALLFVLFMCVAWVAYAGLMDARTLRNKAKAEGHVVGSLFSYLGPAMTLASAQHREAKGQSSQVADNIPLPAGSLGTFIFAYVDRDGEAGRRTVDVHKISQSDGLTYLEGYCHKRNADRTFRTDRIQGRLTNAETGEVIDAEDLLLSVQKRSPMTFKPGVKSDGAKWQTAVLFAGFSESELEELEELASDAGWDVRAAVSPSLDYLVTGPLAVRSKVANAKELGVRVIDKDLFRALV